MAGLRPPLPRRRLTGPAQPTRDPDQGGGATSPDRVIVTTPLTNTVRTTSTTQRDVTSARERALEEADHRRIRRSDASRLSESNRRPSHYECDRLRFSGVHPRT